MYSFKLRETDSSTAFVRLAAGLLVVDPAEQDRLRRALLNRVARIEAAGFPRSRISFDSDNFMLDKIAGRIYLDKSVIASSGAVESLALDIVPKYFGRLADCVDVLSSLRTMAIFADRVADLSQRQVGGFFDGQEWLTWDQTADIFANLISQQRRQIFRDGNFVTSSDLYQALAHMGATDQDAAHLFYPRFDYDSDAVRLEQRIVVRRPRSIVSAYSINVAHLDDESKLVRSLSQVIADTGHTTQ